MNVVNALYKHASRVQSKDVCDAYTYLAITNSLDNYRIYTLKTIVDAGIKDSIPVYFLDFVGKHGKVLGIGNILNGEVYSIKFKTLKDKDFMTLGKKRTIPYGMGMLSTDFKYGDWVILVEGEKDRDSLAQLYPNVVATSTAGASSMMSEILLTLTNRFIGYYDNDEAGNKAFNKNRKFFVEHRCQFEKGIHPDGCKDSGSLIDYLYKGRTYEYEFSLSHYAIFLSTML